MVEMKDVAMNVVILMLFINGVPNLLLASGVAADLGIDPAVSGDQAIKEGNNAMQNVKVDGGFASTLFTLYTSVTGPVRTVMAILFGAPVMLASIGIPSWVLSFLFLPQYMVVGGTVIYMLASRAI